MRSSDKMRKDAGRSQRNMDSKTKRLKKDNINCLLKGKSENR